MHLECSGSLMSAPQNSDFSCVCAVMVPIVLEEGDTRPPRAGVSGGCELPTRVLESGLDPVEEQPALFPVEPALQPCQLSDATREPGRRFRQSLGVPGLTVSAAVHDSG